MTDSASAHLSDDEYLPIWSAIMETPRGRRFLSEFARRTRSSEARTLLDAVQTLERALLTERARADDPTGPGPSPAAVSDGGCAVVVREAVEVLDNVVRIHEHAAADLRRSIDAVEDTLDALRDRRLGADAFAALRRQADDMREIVTVQQIASQRAARIGDALDSLATRVDDPAVPRRPVADAATPRKRAART